MQTLAQALAQKTGKILPWKSIHTVITNALNTGVLELATDSEKWPAEQTRTALVKLHLPVEKPQVAQSAPSDQSDFSYPSPNRVRPKHVLAEASLELHQLQDLADNMAEIKKAAAGYNLHFRLRIELEVGVSPPIETIREIKRLLGEIDPNLELG